MADDLITQKFREFLPETSCFNKPEDYIFFDGSLYFKNKILPNSKMVLGEKIALAYAVGYIKKESDDDFDYVFNE